MPPPAELRFRAARADDAAPVARLQAGSWQRNYRGAYSDHFLDDEAPGLFLDRWASRLTRPDPRARTILAELGGELDGEPGRGPARDPARDPGRELVGLAHVILREDPAWGALLYNLHVSHDRKRQRIGSGLLALTARAVLDDDPSSGLYLWVLDQNTAARAFYQARGGTRGDSEPVAAPGGDPARLVGAPVSLRIAWPDPSVLLAP